MKSALLQIAINLAFQELHSNVDCSTARPGDRCSTVVEEIYGTHSPSLHRIAEKRYLCEVPADRYEGYIHI